MNFNQLTLEQHGATRATWRNHHERPMATPTPKICSTRIKVCPLVGVDALSEHTPHEGNGMVLVVTLSISQDRIAGKFHAEFCLWRAENKTMTQWQVMSSPTNHEWRWMICFSNSWHATEDSRLVWRSSCNEIEHTNRKETQQNANFIGTLHRRARLFQTTWEFLTCAVNQTAVVAPLLFRVNQVQLGRDAFVVLNGLILPGTTNFNELSRYHGYHGYHMLSSSHYNWQTCFKGWNPGKHWKTSPKGTLMCDKVSWCFLAIVTHAKADWLGFVLFTKLQGIGQRSQAAQSMNATFRQSGNLANILHRCWENSHSTKSFQLTDHVIKCDGIDSIRPCSVWT